MQADGFVAFIQRRRPEVSWHPDSVVADSRSARCCIDGPWQSRRTCANQRAPPACLFCNRARRLILLALAYFSHSNSSANAVLYYILTYGLTTIGAFGVVSVVERATGSDRLDSFLGLHKRNPLLAAVLLVLFLSLAGIPPLVGFWAKFNLFAAVLSVSAGPVPFALVALAIAMSAVSLYYYLQVLKRAYVMPASR